MIANEIIETARRLQKLTEFRERVCAAVGEHLNATDDSIIEKIKFAAVYTRAITDAGQKASEELLKQGIRPVFCW